MSTCLRHKIVKTRKSHQCFGCEEPIPIGDKAQCSVYVDNGTVYNFYLCLPCIDYRNKEDVEEFCQGDLRERLKQLEETK